MRRMYGEERHIAVLKAELENFIDDEDDNSNPDFSEDLVQTKIKYTKKNPRAMKDKPHFRPIQSNSEKQKKVDSGLGVRPLESYNSSSSSSGRNSTTDMSNDTLEEDTGVSYKTKLESIANIEINNLDPDVITLEAVIKQSIETNSIYPKFSAASKAEPPDDKNNTKGNSTSSESLTTTEMSDEPYDDDGTTDKDTWNGTDGSTLPPTLLFSEHEKVKDSDNRDGDKESQEANPKPTHQETMRPAVIKLRGA